MLHWSIPGLCSTLLLAAATFAQAGTYQIITPMVGAPFHLLHDFQALEPIVSETGKPLPGWVGAGHMILLRDGRLLLAYASENKCRTTTSSDEGATWTTPVIANVSLPAEFKDAQTHRPAIAQSRSGRLWLFFYSLVKYDVANPEKSINPLWSANSVDGGQTWSAPKRIQDGYVGMLQGAIVTRDGHIVVPVCRYAAVRRYEGLCIVSTDDGETWKPSNALDIPDPEPSAEFPYPLSPNSSRGAIEPSVAELPDGRLLMNIRTIHDAMFESYSRDGGMTWSSPTRSTLSCGGPGNIVQLPGGRIAIAYNPANFESAIGKRWGSPIGYDRQSIALLNEAGDGWRVTHDFVKQIKKAERVVHSTITGLPGGDLLLTMPGRSTLVRTTATSLAGATR